MIVAFFVIVFILPGVMVTKAQNGTFKVQNGDKNMYKFDKFYNQMQSSVNVSELLANGSKMTIMLKTGFNYTVQSCGYSTNTNTNITSPLMTFSFAGNATKCDVAFPSYFSAPYINPIANISYYQNLVASNSTIYQLTGDSFTSNLTYDYRSNGGSYGWELTTYNIKTGWLERYEDANYLFGSLQSDSIVSLIPSTSSTSSSSPGGSSPGFELLSVLGFFIVIAPVIILNRKKHEI